MTKAKTSTNEKPTRVRPSRAKGEVIERLKVLPLLGEIITWSPKRDSQYTSNAVATALKDSGLDPEMVRERQPRHAFARAVHQLKAEGLIEELRDDGDSMIFQLSERDRRPDEIHYNKKDFIELDKTTGVVKCRHADTQARVQREVDRCKDIRSTNDITQIVQELFEREERISPAVALIPIRDQGGAYLVVQEGLAFVDKVEAFLTALGGRVNRFPVPAGTPKASAAVQDAIASNLSAVVAEHEDAVACFSLDSRADTLERAAERIKATRTKVEAFAHYLSERREELLATLDEARNTLAQKIEAAEEYKKTAPTTPRVQKDGTDTYGFRIGSNASKVNATLNNVPKSMAEITTEAGVTGTYYQHLRKMVSMGHVVTVGKKYKLVVKE